MQKDKLNQIYGLYQKGELEQASVLVEQVLESAPDNIYAKKYRDLINSKSKRPAKKEIPKVKGKQLKCPACLSKIGFSALTEKTRKSIKDGDYNNKEIKCPYCHKKFVLQKRKAKSIVGIKIGDIANINNKKYRATGYIEYEGTWREGSYSGKLYYLEWILVGIDNSYKYFSEGYFIDEGIKEEEFDISEKFIPKGKINTKYYKEINNLKVKSIYGENSKSFSIGEKVEILDFGDYVLEKEGAGRQAEAGFYRGKTISKKDSFNIFGKRLDKINQETNNEFKSGLKLIGVMCFAIFGAIFIVIFLEFFKEIIIWFIPIIFKFLFISIIGFLIFIIGFSIYNTKVKINKTGDAIIISSIIAIATYNISNLIFSDPDISNRNKIDFSQASIGENYQIRFSKENIEKEKVISNTKYDYGGVKRKYEQNIGIKFSLQDEKDLETLSQIKEVKRYEVIKTLKTIKNGDLYRVD